MLQAGLTSGEPQAITTGDAYHINQRNEGIDLNGVSGALMHTQNMQMQTFVTQPEKKEIIAFAQNQRDEVRDLHNIAGALSAQPGMKQQTYIADGCLKACDKLGQPVFTQETISSVLCLMDQGGEVMGCTEKISGTLRAQEHGHQPLIYENHGIDARYRQMDGISPTIFARCGTGGNNVPLIGMDEPEVYCIVGNVIDREPQNGGNGKGYQGDISYTLTATDKHCVFARQRVDAFREDTVVSTESARQHKDATDLVYQETVGALTSSDVKGPSSQYVSQDKCIVEGPKLIRRLTPLECERLQGFPDGWTDIEKASDSARYKALGNSVAIPCVEFVIGVIAKALRKEVSYVGYALW